MPATYSLTPFDSRPDLEAVEVMEPGPSTVRPDGLLEPLVGRMHARKASHVIVTTPQGRLIGVLIREEADRLLAGEPPSQIWRDCKGCPGRWGDKMEAPGRRGHSRLAR